MQIYFLRPSLIIFDRDDNNSDHICVIEKSLWNDSVKSATQLLEKP